MGNKNHVTYDEVMPGEPVVYPTVTPPKASSGPLIANQFNNKNVVRVSNTNTKCQEHIDYATSKAETKGLTGLMRAAHLGDVQCVKELVKLYDVNAVTEYGDTALTAAIYNGNTDMVELLLANGADPELKTTVSNGVASGTLTPYSYALSLSQKAEKEGIQSQKIIRGRILVVIEEAIAKRHIGGRRRLNRGRTTRKGKSKKNTRRNKK
jgi:hypothetical protein